MKFVCDFASLREILSLFSPITLNFCHSMINHKIFILAELPNLLNLRLCLNYFICFPTLNDLVLA